ncbi:MAG: hypothetical protein IAE99_01515 [Rhodothermales bacterium]|nr:hypothetical protein [Rhodothermales bacterium]
MNRRTFVQRTGAASAALALAPADLLFPGSDAVASVSDDDVRALLDRLRAEAPCRSEVRMERGGPRLFVNGAEKVPFWGLSTALLTGPLANFQQMGIRLIQPNLGMAESWTGPGQYDFRALETYMARLLVLDPDAYLFPRMHLYTPIWWKDAHPDEIGVLGMSGVGPAWDIMKREGFPPGEGNKRFAPMIDAREASYASDLWRNDTAAMLRAFVAFIEQSPLAARMMGYFPVHGNTEEWNIWGDDFMPDYSAPMERVAGPIPPVRERMHSAYGLLRDPAKEAHVVEFYRRFHAVRAETAASLAATVKAAMHRRVIVGTFFGYLMETPRIQESGHLVPDAVLNSPDIDVVACPYTYISTNDPNVHRMESDLYDGAGTWLGRGRGVGGDGAFRSAVESYQRRGKLYISEIDPSTYLDATHRWRIIGGSGHETKEGTVQILRRDLGNVMAAGVGGWFYDFGPLHDVPGGWYGSPEIIDACRPIVAMMERRLSHDIGSIAQIAIAGDVESYFVTQHWQDARPWPGQGIRYTDFFNHWFLNVQARTVNRIGAPHDLLYRTDLRAEDFRRYRLVLVPNTYLLRPDEVDALHERLRGSGCTVVWYYAPGLLRPDGVDLAQMERLTGFRFEELDAPGALTIDALEPDGQKKPFGIRSPLLYSPRFAVQPEGNVETLGYWTGGEQIAFARRAMDGWTSVYVGTAPLPADVLRRLAADAGAAVWTNRPAVVTASKAGAMVVCTDPGTEQRYSTAPAPETPPVYGPLVVAFPEALREDGTGPAQTSHTLNVTFGDVRLFVP